MLSFLSILLAVAAFATMASAIPTAPRSYDAASGDTIVNSRSIQVDAKRQYVDAYGNVDASPSRRSADAASGDTIINSRSIDAKRHVHADIPVKRGYVQVGAYGDVEASSSRRSVDAENHAANKRGGFGLGSSYSYGMSSSRRSESVDARRRYTHQAR